MSEKLLKLFLSELRTIRLVCTRDGCGAIMEITLDQFAAATHLACPLCHTSYQTTMPSGHMDPIRMLAVGMQTLAAAKDRFQVQFVVPQPDEPTA